MLVRHLLVGKRGFAGFCEHFPIYFFTRIAVYIYSVLAAGAVTRGGILNAWQIFEMTIAAVNETRRMKPMTAGYQPSQTIKP